MGNELNYCAGAGGEIQNQFLPPSQIRDEPLQVGREAPHTGMDGPANRKDVTLRKGLSARLPPSASGHEFSAEWRTKEREIERWLLGISERIQVFCPRDSLTGLQ